MRIQNFLTKGLVLIPLTSVALTANSATSIAAMKETNGAATYFAIHNEKSISIAQSKSLMQCKNHVKEQGLTESCKIVFSHKGPGYFATVFSQNGDHFGVGYSKDKQEAINNAYAQCVENGSVICNGSPEEVYWDGGSKNMTEPTIATATPSSAPDSCEERKLKTYHVREIQEIAKTRPLTRLEMVSLQSYQLDLSCEMGSGK